MIDFRQPCLMFKSNENLIYLAFSANAFLATGTVMLLISISLTNSSENKTLEDINQLVNKSMKIIQQSLNMEEMKNKVENN